MNAPNSIQPDTLKLAYSVGDAGALLGVSKATVYRLMNTRKLAARKVAGRTVVTRTDLEGFLADLPPHHGKG
jgi:excisionase family DNA binding protein